MPKKKEEHDSVIERIPSGIKGLDEVIEGGFEKDSVILVSGGGGSGKTIFGMGFLMEGILKNNETGVYISFEESKEKFYRHMLRFGWNLADLEKKGLFIFIKYTPEKIAKIVKDGGEEIGKELKEIKAKRIVIDSLSAYTVLFEKESEQRKMLVSLFEMVEKWDCTTVVIAEENPSIEKYHSSVMGFMADSIIYLYNIIKENRILIRGMQVAKMRGTKHAFSIFPFMIGKNGIQAFPSEGLYQFTPKRE